MTKREATPGARTLSNAREVLRALSFLQERPQGVDPKEVASSATRVGRAPGASATLLQEAVHLQNERKEGPALDSEKSKEGLYCLVVSVRVQGIPAALDLVASRGRFLVQGDRLAVLLRGLLPKEV